MCPVHLLRKKCEPDPLCDNERVNLCSGRAPEHRSLALKTGIQDPMVFLTEDVCAVVLDGPEAPLPPCCSLISGMMNGTICRT